MSDTPTEHEQLKQYNVARKMADDFQRREFVMCEYCDFMTRTTEFMAMHLISRHDIRVILKSI